MLIMSFTTDKPVILLDAQQRQLGQIEVERTEGDLLFGKFLPEPAFAAVARLFRDFEEAADCQALAVVDKLDAAIVALGLTLRFPDGSRSVNLSDVQIWTDGGITCRMCDLLPKSANGRVQETQPGRVGAR
jgi:hypothetical protein